MYVPGAPDSVILLIGARESVNKELWLGTTGSRNLFLNYFRILWDVFKPQQCLILSENGKAL